MNNPLELNRLYNSDCIKLIKRMPPNFLDKVITSPPYNIGRNYNDGYVDNLQRQTFIDWQVTMLNELEPKLKTNGLILYNFSYAIRDPLLPYSLIEAFDKNTGFTIVDTIIWKKPHCIPIVNTNRLSRICEFVYVLSRKTEVSTFTTNREGLFDKNGNPHLRNVQNFIEADNSDKLDVPFNESTYSTELILKLLYIYAKQGETIYDPFSGLGTTIRACLIYGCNFIGSELDWRQSNYFNNKRLEAVQNNLPNLIRRYKYEFGLDFLNDENEEE